MLLYVLFLLSACAVPGSAPNETSEQAFELKPTAVSNLPGWQADHIVAALQAFNVSCAALAVSPMNEALGGAGLAEQLGGQAGKWRNLCSTSRALPPADESAARHFVETQFQAYAVSRHGNADGLYTGYYEPQVNGARSRGGAYQTPIYARPIDLVQVDLGEFTDDLKGRRIEGRVVSGNLAPYYDRSEIEHGALQGKRAELLYLADPVDAFFLQIQGSGRVILPNGGVVRVTYAAKNGRPYIPIGRVLSASGDIPAEQISMQSIRAWLNAHPSRAADVMDQNPSYCVFSGATKQQPK